MNIEERKQLNEQKLTGIQQRLGQIEAEKQELLQEALRLDGELRILNEQLTEKPKKKGDDYGHSRTGNLSFSDRDFDTRWRYRLSQTPVQKWQPQWD